jgi:predicted nucleotide-binding protein (sugar kinase/HSP70/actin superfamily)
MSNNVHADTKKKVALPIMKGAETLDLDAELAAFEAEERARLGLDKERDQWIEKMAALEFTRGDREKYQVTILISGLTMAQDYFIEGAMKGLGNRVQHLECPDNEALRHGKEFGNRGQCNPTYFTVGNLVKYLCQLRDQHGMSAEEIVKKYVFLTAGACGPCRFGMYVTEYRKALRDAGFDGFRVLLFQQKGGFEQATGESAPGIELNPAFFIGLIKGLVAGDVVNALGYRIRPYEVVPGSTDKALEKVKKTVYDALCNRKSVLLALLSARRELAKVKVDKIQAKPKVSIIGEFWAMTTEGDGNYQLQRFLEGEGAEADVQLVSAWILYTIWEGRNDIKNRMNLRGSDTSRYGLGNMQGVTDVQRTRALLHLADKAVRVVFHTFGLFAGLDGYVLPNMDEIAEVASKFYNNDLRGGEGHMEVGKLILNVVHQKAHMTLSVKPFGCMPSAGVSDGVQSLITEMHPGSIFCPVETSGDGKVNFYSRVQMYLFKAKLKAQEELQAALDQYGLTREQVEAWLAKHPRYASSLHKAPHAAAGSGADLVHEIAPIMTKSLGERMFAKASAALDAAVQAVPVAAAKAKALWAMRDDAIAFAKEDAVMIGELLQGKVRKEWVELATRFAGNHEEALNEARRVDAEMATSGIAAAAE